MTLAYEPDIEGALGRLVRAGSAGVTLGDGITAGVAIHLALLGHCTISNRAVSPQRAVVTAQGVAFSRRRAFA